VHLAGAPSWRFSSRQGLCYNSFAPTGAGSILFKAVVLDNNAAVVGLSDVNQVSALERSLIDVERRPWVDTGRKQATRGVSGSWQADKVWWWHI
jgi:hypothetical protein